MVRVDFKNRGWKCKVCGSEDIIEYGYGVAYNNECQVCGNLAEDVWEMAIHKDTEDEKLQKELKRIDDFFKGKTKEEVLEILKKYK